MEFTLFSGTTKLELKTSARAYNGNAEKFGARIATCHQTADLEDCLTLFAFPFFDIHRDTTPLTKSPERALRPSKHTTFPADRALAEAAEENLYTSSNLAPVA
jgi:hypothetical protein